MKYLTREDILNLHQKGLAAHGGDPGIRDEGLLESAVAQPRMTYGGQDLYPTLVQKAAALGFSLVKNHAFVDGNKRVAHWAMETFLGVNGFEIFADTDEQETVFRRLAGEGPPISREAFTDWLRGCIVERQNPQTGKRSS